MFKKFETVQNIPFVIKLTFLYNSDVWKDGGPFTVKHVVL